MRTLSSSPYPPDVLKIEDIQHDSVLFRWDGGEENGSNIENHRIRMKKRDETEWKVVSDRIESSCQHHLLKDLLSSCEYVVFEYENITHISLIYHSYITLSK